ncbi:hypothetical protein ABB37_08136 [Leptomonas pyrrhocoris]|uniref:Uncharacterized protein n=1 Tax=Leptomonas pyrrhocoris TaxID=157538 RepID=A0A0N0DSI3_LEPPY|nr:hypothetical protein ABB37_08136 [Leptomonas pyrrhocoris]KPA75984.1 hypothetical protein ABB37_08136 [Leptomonas pyrrhocoris]|eukprot:XP_015654423.1 hypothetical protein ABB37_08136 [Leptomonas pyrrhocoris]
MRTRFWQVLVLGAVVAVTALSCTALAVTDASYTTVTLAGRISQDHEGVFGVNSILAPSSLCGGYDPLNADSVIMVGAANYMFTLNRYSTQLNFFFGNPNASGSTVDWTTATSAPFGTIRLSSPIYACVTTPRTASNSTIFYVSNDRYLYRADPDTQLIYATAIAEDPATEYMWDLALYNNKIYVLTTNRVVYACDYVNAVTCVKVNIRGDAAFNAIVTPTRPKLGIAVSRDGIFIAPESNLYWFSLSGVMVAKTPDAVTYVDVSFTQDQNPLARAATSLMAASTTNLYSIALANNALTPTLLTTTAYPDPLQRIYPLTLDNVLISQPTPNLVRWTTYDNTSVASAFDQTPYPVGFVDQSTVVPLLLSYMNYELVQVAGTVPYPSVAINASTLAVDPPTWTTAFGVDVSNHYYTPDLGAAIQNASASGGYPLSMRALHSYYNRTNEMIGGDYNLLPLCNVTKMTSIRHSLAADVRTLLRYPLIYTGEPRPFTVNGQPNLTLIKLIMPSPFGTYLNESSFTANATTPRLLATYDAATRMVVYTRVNYPTSRIFDALFPLSSYPRFASLTDAEKQTLRWAVYADVMAQLAKCAAAAGGSNSSGSNGGGDGSGGNGGSGDGGDDMVPGCVPRVGIDNMTQYAVPGVSPTPFNFTVFVPEGLYKNFNVTSCLDGTDWTNVNEYNSTLTPKKTKCGTGCIVGVAVASAVVAAVLVVVIVILTSKRRRLATVIVPMSNTEPKFSSTVDADSNYESGNPLAY